MGFNSGFKGLRSTSRYIPGFNDSSSTVGSPLLLRQQKIKIAERNWRGCLLFMIATNFAFFILLDKLNCSFFKKSPLFWDVTQRRYFRRFDTTYFSHFQGSNNPKIFFLDHSTFEDGNDRLPRNVWNINLRCVTFQKSLKPRTKHQAMNVYGGMEL